MAQGVVAYLAPKHSLHFIVTPTFVACWGDPNDSIALASTPTFGRQRHSEHVIKITFGIGIDIVVKPPQLHNLTKSPSP